MIPELTYLAVLVVLGGLALVWLAESGKLEDYSEKRHVNKLADKSRKHKPMASRQSRWAGIGFRGINL